MKCIYCNKSRDNGIVKRSLHRFPMKRPKELQSWLKVLKMEHYSLPLENVRLCSDHFSQECFTRGNGEISLHQGSIPTIFNEPKYFTRCFYCHVPRNADRDRSFYKFPIKNSELQNQWVSAMPKQHATPTEHDVLCSDHFERNCLRWKRNHLQLKRNVVPSIFERQSSTEINCSESETMASTSGADPEIEASMEGVSTVPDKVRNDNPERNVGLSGNELTDISSTPDCSTEDGTTVPDVTSDSPSSPSNPAGSCTPLRMQCLLESVSTPTKSPRQKYPQSFRHDHRYFTSPSSTAKQLIVAKKKLMKYAEEVKNYKDRIKRLTKRIASLKDDVRTLRKNVRSQQTQNLGNEKQHGARPLCYFTTSLDSDDIHVRAH